MDAKLASVVIVASLCWGCRGSQSEVGKIIESGVEVVLNPAAPVRLKGEPSLLTLEKVFVLDTEDDTTAPDYAKKIYLMFMG